MGNLSSNDSVSLGDLRNKRELAIWKHGHKTQYFHAILDYLDDSGVVGLVYYSDLINGGSNKIETRREFRLIDVEIPSIYQAEKSDRLFALESYYFLRKCLGDKILSVQIDYPNRDENGLLFAEISANGHSINRELVVRRLAFQCEDAKLSVL